MTRKILVNLFLFALGYLLLFGVTYKLLENPQIYNRYFSNFMPTYDNQSGTIYLIKKPFTKITAEGYNIMDAAHYSYMKDNLYTVDPNDFETNYNYGFFPLFPIVWKFFTGIGVVTLNYFLYFISISILAYIFCRKKIIVAVAIALSLPTLTIFFLPYTEALFMFSISIALLGNAKTNKPIYIFGLILASTTRPVFLLILGTLIATEIFQYIRTKKIDYKHLLITFSTIIFSTFLVSLFQYSFHKSSLFTFMTVQSHWGTFFRIPHTINDWSMEGYGMNVWVLLFCFVFGITILISTLLKKSTSESTFDYWYYFSWIYLVGTCCYVLLFQGGCLHSLYRYTLCSPFFYVIVFQHINNIETLFQKYSLLLGVILLFLCCLFFNFFDYYSDWKFSKTGFFLLMGNLFLLICLPKLNTISKYIGFTILILSSILWNCFLYNMFFSHGWVFL